MGEIVDITNMLLWIEGLESDEFQQGKGYLNLNDKEFCSIGVACEVAIRNGVDLDKYQLSTGIYAYDGSTSLMPNIVKNWTGISTLWLPYNNEKASLYAINDAHKRTLKEIATILRKEYINNG